MYDTKVQTPISSKVLLKAKKKAEQAGFSSVNDVIRIILNQFAEGNINFNVSITSVKSSIPEVSDDEQKEVARILREIKNRNDDVVVANDTITL